MSYAAKCPRHSLVQEFAIRRYIVVFFFYLPSLEGLPFSVYEVLELSLIPPYRSLLAGHMEGAWFMGFMPVMHLPFLGSGELSTSD